MTRSWCDDSFLDDLRSQADALADETVRRLEAEHGVEAVNELFRSFHTNDQPIPEGAPAPYLDFLEATRQHLPQLDVERLERGGAVFLRHAFSAATVLLLSSLPAGYSAPCLSRILTVSGDLEKHPYERLMGVLQLLVNISQARAFRLGGEGLVAAQKLRLLHSGIRTVVPRFRPDYRERYGPPVNHEDMLATIMGFSYLVITGLRTLGAALSEQEEEDFYYLWRSFALLMGIHPPGAPLDDQLIPATVGQAAAFYAAYSRRHYTAAGENPDGIRLALDNLAMVKGLIPWPLRLLGFGLLPRILMTELLGEEGARRVGIAPVTGRRLLTALFLIPLRLVQGAMDHAPGHLGERLGRLVFQEMIDKDRGGEVTFLVPESLAEMRQLA